MSDPTTICYDGATCEYLSVELRARHENPVITYHLLLAGEIILAWGIARTGTIPSGILECHGMMRFAHTMSLIRDYSVLAQR